MLFDEDTCRQAKGYMSERGRHCLELECQATGLSELEVMRRRVAARLSEPEPKPEPLESSLPPRLQLAIDNTKS